MTQPADIPRPFRYLDEDEFCLSARLLPDLNAGGTTGIMSITVEGSDEPQSAHVPVTDLPQILAGIAAAAGLAPAAPAAEFELRGDTEIRAAVLREAADRFERECPDADGPMELCMCHAAEPLREWADEAQQPETEAPYPTTTTWTVEGQDKDGTWIEWGDHYTSNKAHELAAEFRRTRPDRESRVVRQVVTTTVEPTPATTEEPK